jgi:hypothetical protein
MVLLSSKYDRLQKVIVIGIFSFLALFYLSGPIVQLPFKIGKDYNEGWNGLHAERIFDSNQLYPKYNDLISNNYPPISFYFVATIGLLTEDNILAGRIIALFSLFIVSYMIMLSIKQFGGNNYEALVMSLFFLAYMALIVEYYIAMNDPQWLGHAIQMTGFVLFLKSKQKGFLFYLSAIVIVLSGFVKLNIISLPLAITVWLLLYNRKALVYWILISFIVISSLLFFFSMMYGIEFLQGLFLDSRTWRLGLLAKNVEYRYTKIFIIIGLGVIGTFLMYPSKPIILLALYSIISAVWGAFISGGSGVDLNSIFDLIISLTLIIGLLLNQPSGFAQKNIVYVNRLHASIIIILLLSLVIHAPLRYKETKKTFRNIYNISQIVADDIDFLASKKGPVMCENLSLCYWSGKNFEVDFFNTGQKIRNGAIDKKKLIKLFEQHYFSVIQVNGSSGSSFRFPKSINEEMLKYYEINRVGIKSGVFLVPKTH